MIKGFEREREREKERKHLDSLVWWGLSLSSIILEDLGLLHIAGGRKKEFISTLWIIRLDSWSTFMKALPSFLT
jgi:hypothetical protein